MPYDTEEHLSAALRDITGGRPFTPDLDRIEDRGRKLRHRRLAWRATAGTGLAAVAAVAVVAVSTNGGGSAAPAPNLAAPAPAVTSSAPTQTPLMQLVGYLTTAEHPEGDATLVVRDQHYKSGLHVKVYDLYTDKGPYYFAKTRGGLPAQVKGHKAQGGGLFAREVAAAEYAATGDLTVARKKMATAPDPSGSKFDSSLKPGEVPALPPDAKKLPKEMLDISQVNSVDNWVWENSMDTFYAGAGNPTVRAGLLRLLATMPEIKVTRGTLDGQPTLTLTAGAPALPRNYTEAITINASTGMPIKFVGDNGAIVVNYTVTRVILANVAKGTF